MSDLILAIDFDGTLVDHRYPKVGEPTPGSIKWLKRFQDLGAKLILWTMRSDGRDDGTKPLTDAIEYCKGHGITFWGINRNPEQHEWTNSRKAYAHIYIDDAGFNCPMIHPEGFARPCVDWETVGPQIEAKLLNRI